MIARAHRGYSTAKGSTDHAAHRCRCPRRLLAVLATAASVQDRDAAKPLLENLRQAFPSIKLA